MRCEVCGCKIHGKPFRVIIEGAKLTVCSGCSKHGKIVWEEPKPKTITTLKTKTTTHPPLRIQRKEKPQTVESVSELAEDFAVKIRKAREKLGISHEELGKKINEKISLLKKIETGKMTPDNKLATKLEHALQIKLIVPASKEKVSQVKIPKPASQELTLGDLMQLNKRKSEEKK